MGLLIVSCKPSDSGTAEKTQETVSDTSVTEVMNIPGLHTLWNSETTLTTSESVLYDKLHNLLYVSCINGVPPDKKDGDGFIAKVGLDGKIITHKWVTGLDGPKGMGLAGSTLYVTDITRLVAIDIESGKIANTWKVDGAVFLNDVAVTEDGIVYFTDSGTSTIYKMADGKVSVFHADATLGGTNGIMVEGNTMYLAAYESGNVYRMNMETKNIEELANEIPGGDGVERYGDALMVSNWNGQVYHISSSGIITLLLDSQEAKLNAADIEVIAEKNMMLVPTFFGNGVTAYELRKNN